MHNQTSPQRLLVLSNPGIPNATELANQVVEWLRAHGKSCEQGVLPDESDMATVPLDHYDMLIALGGDGSMLRAGRLCATRDIPLLGINVGHFGFLVEINENEWQDKLTQLLDGNYRVEERMMLKAEFCKGDTVVHQWDVINEVVVCRGQYVRPIEIRVTMNDGYLTSYIADGLIAATATGSTAYALAAGGPILPPELRNILLIPIAPHFSLDRAVILDEGSSVCIEVRSRHETVISVDGMDPMIMLNDDKVRVTANRKTLKMVRFQDRCYFYRNLAIYMENNPLTGIKKNE
jgi:NAD+ kinase